MKQMLTTNRNRISPSFLYVMRIIVMVLWWGGINVEALAADATGNDRITAGEKNIASYSAQSNPSRLSVTYVNFLSPKYDQTQQTSPEFDYAYKIGSHLYPFGESDGAFGIGIDFCILDQKEEDETILGPIGLSARLRIWTGRGFDVEGVLTADLARFSDEMLEESTLGRDVYTVGLSIAKTTDTFYIRNDIRYSLESETSMTVANREYDFDYGSILMLRIKGGKQLGMVGIGGFFEFYQTDTLTIEGGDFKYTMGKAYITAAGPEISFQKDNMQLTLSGRFMLDSDKDIDFDRLGNLAGIGLGQGHLGVTFNVFF